MNPVVLLVSLSLCHTLVLSGPVSPIRSYVASEEDVSRMSYILVDNGNGTIVTEDLTSAIVQARATENDVTYYLYSKSHKEDGVAIKSVSPNLTQSTFDPNKELLVIIHGWSNNFSSPVNTLIKSAVLDKFDLNIIVVDWSPIASKNYITAKNAVPQIGGYVGNFMKSLISTHQIPPSRVSLIGHSLGAHVAGIVGSTLNGSIDHIVGLDPASPLISISDTNFCLDTSDAKFVQVIHTNGALLGLSSSIGHADYFPNGGQRQPGCGLDITGACAHGRSYQYYAASIQDNEFFSQHCSSYKEFTAGRCSGSISHMGGYSIEEKVSGDFYLETKETYPYALGKIA